MAMRSQGVSSKKSSPEGTPIVEKGTDYVVKPGDTLSAIARAAKTTVAKLLSANPKLSSLDKYMGGSRIFSGTQVKIPGFAEGGMAGSLTSPRQKKPGVPYSRSGRPIGDPFGQYWGELSRFIGPRSPGMDIWGGTEIPGLKFSGKIPQMSDYWHQMQEQPRKPFNGPGMGVDRDPMRFAGSGASMGGIGNGAYGLGPLMFANGGMVSSAPHAMGMSSMGSPAPAKNPSLWSKLVHGLIKQTDPFKGLGYNFLGGKEIANVFSGTGTKLDYLTAALTPLGIGKAGKLVGAGRTGLVPRTKEVQDAIDSAKKWNAYRRDELKKVEDANPEYSKLFELMKAADDETYALKIKGAQGPEIRGPLYKALHETPGSPEGELFKKHSANDSPYWKYLKDRYYFEDELIKITKAEKYNITPMEVKALRDYLEKPLTGHLDSMKGPIEKLVSRFTIPEGTVSYRGLSDLDMEAISNLGIGESFVANTVRSITNDRTAAAAIGAFGGTSGGKTNAIARIIFGPDVKGIADVSALGEAQGLSHEGLIGANTRFILEKIIKGSTQASRYENQVGVHAMRSVPGKGNIITQDLDEYVLRAVKMKLGGMVSSAPHAMGMSSFGSSNPAKKQNWFQRYVSSLSGMPGAETFGTAALLRKIAGQGRKGDSLSAAMLPLNFMGAGLGSKIGGISKAASAAASSPIKIKMGKATKDINDVIKFPELLDYTEFKTLQSNVPASLNITQLVEHIKSGDTGYLKSLNEITPDEVRREIFGSIFAGKAGLVAPVIKPYKTPYSFPHNLGIFSKSVDEISKGSLTEKTILEKLSKDPMFSSVFKPLENVSALPTRTFAALGMTSERSYRNAILDALGYSDAHGGNLIINPIGKKAGAIDFGRIGDSKHSLDIFGDQQKSIDRLKNRYYQGLSYLPESERDAYLEGLQRAQSTLSGVKDSDLIEMLSASGYSADSMPIKLYKQYIENVKTAIESRLSSKKIVGWDEDIPKISADADWYKKTNYGDTSDYAMGGPVRKYAGGGLIGKLAGILSKSKDLAYKPINLLNQYMNYFKAKKMVKKGMFHGSADLGQNSDGPFKGVTDLSGDYARDPYYGMGFYGTSSKAEADLYAGGYNVPGQWGESYGSLNKITKIPFGKYLDFSKDLKNQNYGLWKLLGERGFMGAGENLGPLMNKAGMTGSIMPRINAGQTGDISMDMAKWIALNKPEGTVLKEVGLGFANGGMVGPKYNIPSTSTSIVNPMPMRYNNGGAVHKYDVGGLVVNAAPGQSEREIASMVVQMLDTKNMLEAAKSGGRGRT
jgi:hypothetical protein